jgi:hypothetical protein
MSNKCNCYIILQYQHFFCEYGIYLIGTIKYDVDIIICDVGII